MLVVVDELEGAEARLLVVGNKGIITVSTRVKNSHRRRFCITHEIGHFEMHREKQELFIDESMREWGKQKKKIEREANQFAAAVLMPERFFAGQCLKETPSLDFVFRLSTDFNASLSANSLRFLKFTDKDLAVVFSFRSIVEWAAYSKSYPHRKYPISKGSRLGMRTEAANTQDNIRPMRKVPALAWYENSQLSKRVKLKEQSWSLGKGDYVISLLPFVPPFAATVGLNTKVYPILCRCV